MPLRKMGLQNVGKFSHFGMAVLRKGGGGLKRNGHWPFCVKKVGMDIVPNSIMQALKVFQAIQTLLFYLENEKKSLEPRFSK